MLASQKENILFTVLIQYVGKDWYIVDIKWIAIN